jgi:hypothetical protein
MEGPSSRHRSSTLASPITITARDRELLEFLAEHRLVLDSHVHSLLGSRSAADARLRALDRAGLVQQGTRFHGQPRSYQITRSGLDAVGSSLPRPRIDLREYKHDVGVAWLWLVARRGAFGPLRELISERALRSGDMTPEGRSRPLGVRLGGVGPRGRESLHYPDLLIVDPHGRRIALELELTPKGAGRRDRILAGYASDARIDAVLYLVEDRRIARKLEASARAVGAGELVRVQPVRFSGFSADGAPRGVSLRERTQKMELAR